MMCLLQGELYFLTIASRADLGKAVGNFEGQGCNEELVYGGQHLGSGSGSVIPPVSIITSYISYINIRISILLIQR